MHYQQKQRLSSILQPFHDLFNSVGFEHYLLHGRWEDENGRWMWSKIMFETPVQPLTTKFWGTDRMTQDCKRDLWLYNHPKSSEELNAFLISLALLKFSTYYETMHY